MSAKRPAGRVRGTGLDATRPRGGGLGASTVALRRADVERVEAAGALRPSATPGDVRSELLALGLAAMGAGWRLVEPRVVDATGADVPRGHARKESGS